MRSIPLFTPAETHSCPYLEGREAQSQYVDPRIEPDLDTMSALSRLGFRRSGKLIYRPSCPSCRECQSIRIPTAEFSPSKNMRRVLARTRHWRVSVCDLSDSPEFFDLYCRYINARHKDGDMYPPSRQTYDEFIGESQGNTQLLLAEDDTGVIGVLVFDKFNDGLSAVYCFYEPEREHESVGTSMILRLTLIARSLGLPYNYLGYYVENCRKMSYKARFSPLEVLSDNDWIRLNPA
ncbi:MULTISPECIES: arginyltransferase [unclassified Thalassolituus]|uniref:arginyltransferase n=1 Tax=unclassified Thalassolituus TaxID=2624967 RepID=UPI000C0DF3B5|nr:MULTISPECIES: arginyltransferase [unclassified Thalassolituus]MBN58439.1 arginyltransferase [Oceanospirillaceae bacterium]MDQ4424934.1 arginyltransferase [Thalassolituus sp.]